MRKQNSSFPVGFISEAGNQLKNNDYFGYVELDEYACYVIADGITDMSGADSAKLAIETMILHFQANPSMSKRTLKRMLKQANKAMQNRESDKNLKASVTVVVTDYRKMRYGYVGNTRLRMYRGGSVYKYTKDMSLSQDMADRQQIAKDEVMRHEERNNLYAYLGKKRFRPYISKKLKLVETDIIALYTRGIWENVDEAELDDVFSEADNEIQASLDNVEELLLSRQPKDLDNYTLACIFVNKIYKDPEKQKRKKRMIFILVLVILAILVIGIVLWFLHNKKTERLENMNYHFTNTVEYINTGNYVRAKEECEQAQELSDKLKDDTMRQRLQEYLFVIETVLLADESFEEKSYDDAYEYYISALERTRYADNIGAGYIENRLDDINTFLAVDEYIRLGDTLLEKEDYAGAEEKYMSAKDTAASIHDIEGKERAMEALEKLYQQKTDAENKQQQEAEAEAKEEVAAAEMAVMGDKACIEEDFVGAKVYYTMAAAKYAELSDTENEQAVQQKLNAVEQKLKEQEEKKDTAAACENQGTICQQSGDLWGAKSQYLSARSIYQELGSDEDVQRLDALIGELDVQIGQGAG